MLERWSGRVYEVPLLLGVLDPILEWMGVESKVGKDGRGRKPRRPVGLYAEVPVFKGMCKLSLRYAESRSSTYFHERIPRSTLSCWELNHGSPVEEVLGFLPETLRVLSCDYTVLDSTK